MEKRNESLDDSPNVAPSIPASGQEYQHVVETEFQNNLWDMILSDDDQQAEDEDKPLPPNKTMRHKN
jgi:hypothetical protein